MTQTPPARKIAVCIPTYNRPQGLRTLLAGLQRMRLPKIRDEELVVVIIDNSATQSAKDIFVDVSKRYRFALVCTWERRKGLCYARNAALEKAIELSATHIAFIDDDEVPHPEWLSALLDVLDSTGAAAAIGPAHPIFEVPPPRWLPLSSFATHAPAGADGFVADGYTSNAIIDMAPIKAHGLRFDMRFNETGGEDTLFFRALQKSNNKIAWAERAIVYDLIPRHRMSARWLWRRWYRTGMTEASLGEPGQGRATHLARGSIRIAGGSLRIAWAALGSTWRRPDRLIASFYTACRGAGLIAHALGRNYAEYAANKYR